MDNVYYVYVLRSTHDPKKHYTGHCTNLDKRLSEHNQGKTKSNKAFAPWIIIYSENLNLYRKLSLVKNISKVALAGNISNHSTSKN